MPKKHPTSARKNAGALEPLRVLIAWRDGDSGTEAIQFAAWLARTTPIQIRAVTVFTRP